jgi:hypothetical protein
MLLLLYCLPLLFKVSQRIGSRCVCYNVYHYCLWFDRGVVHFVVAILSTNHSSVIHSTVMVDNITTTT